MNAQQPPVGPHPSAGVALIGTLLWSSPGQAADVLALVRDEDMSTPALTAVLAAVRGLVDSGVPPGPQLVLDALKREGVVRSFACRALTDATTCGAVPEAARQYGAAVVAESLRRRMESAGVALTAAATEASEADLAPMVNRAAESVADCARRLELLRGETL